MTEYIASKFQAIAEKLQKKFLVVYFLPHSRQCTTVRHLVACNYYRHLATKYKPRMVFTVQWLP